ncbi:branched-chain amino acid ABC transporter permease (plasmid) [Natrinema zhouii]|uniref:branched-chain amino acid ABC transporter permease n=1 Tax=Natrinema zhouii TaxID=1710539 RepID=UPI001CFF622A|nr:branched-chain amino acid ABC transporter permease [Natrinema zhouii]UHQ98755.1 branched-chain amino acid ABC transporter permease [Natrinema zhouii]
MSEKTQTRKEQFRELINGSVPIAERRIDVAVIAGLIAVAVAMPTVAGVLMGYPGVASNVLIWMLFAVSFNLLLGYTGLLSFGHAMFLGGSMYVIAIVMTQFGPGMIVIGIPLALALMGLLAYGIGRLIVQKGEIYFALLTIAFGEVIWYIANSNPGGVTGGDDGIASGLLPPLVESYRGILTIELGSFIVSMYWAVAAVFVVATYLLFRIVRSPFGRTLITIRENEQLARSIGVNTRRYKVHAFMLSAVFSAVAGTMLLIVNQSVATSYLYWETSGEVVMMTIVGGLSSFAGPMFGAFLWFLGSEFLSGWQAIGALRHYWQFGFGLLFIIIILVEPRKGGWGAIKKGARWAANKLLGGN